MRKFFCFFAVLIITSVSFAQTQQGIVRTPGRENKPSKKVENVAIRLVGAHNDEKSDANGAFSLSLGSSAKNNTFQIGSVRRMGYTIFDRGIKFPKLYPVSNVPIEIVMIKTEDLEREKQEWEDRGYKYAEREYQKKLVALQKQYKNSEEEYNKRLNELEDWYTKYQSLVEGMAEYYVHVDFDKLDEGLRQITKAIADGEYMVADSLINVYAPNLEDEVEQSIKAKEANREQKAFGESIVAKAIADSIEIAKKDERTASYLYAKYTTAVSDNRWNDALHNLKLRADLDTTNIQNVWNYALLAHKQNYFADAIQYYNIGISSYKNNSSIDFARMLCALGDVYFDTHDLVNAEYYFKEALFRAEQIKDDHLAEGIKSTLSDIFMKLGNCYNELGNPSQAESYLHLALDNVTQLVALNHDKYEGDLNGILANLGVFYSINRQYLESEKYLLQVMENYNGKEPDLNYSRIISNLGAVYYQRHDYESSRKYLTKALTIAKELFEKNPTAYRLDLAKSLESFAALCSSLNDYNSALEHYQSALKIFQEEFDLNPVLNVNRINISRIHFNIGKLYYNLKRYLESAEYLKESLYHREILFKENPEAYRKLLAETSSILGNLYKSCKNYTESEKYYQVALQHYDLLNHTSDIYNNEISNIYNNIANLYSNKNDYINAEKYYKLAFEKYELLLKNDTIAYRHEIYKIQYNLARLYYKLHNYKNSETLYLQALSNCEILYKEYPDIYHEHLGKIQGNLGKLYDDIEDYDNAIKFYQLSEEKYKLLFQKNPNEYRPHLAIIQNSIGLVYNKKNDFAKSEEYYQLALGHYELLFNQSPDEYRVAISCTQRDLGLLYLGSNDYLNSEKYLNLALEHKQI